MSLAENAECTEKDILNELAYKVRGVIFDVFKELGPGLMESVYEAALIYEFNLHDIPVKSQVPVSVPYKSIQLDVGFRLDLLVDDEIIIEVKSIESLQNVHKKQLLTYLRLTNKRLGFLINFNTDFIKEKESLVRIVNNF